MVTYPTWTSIVFDVAKAEGAQFKGIADGAVVIEDVAAPIWSERKEELQTASRPEARDIARREVEVV